MKVQSVPQISHSTYVSPTSCEQAVRTGTYSLIGGGEKIKITYNGWVVIDQTERGSLNEKNQAVSCTGEPMHINGMLHSNMLVLREFRVLKVTLLKSGDQMEVQDDHVSLSCPYPRLGCATGTATYTWHTAEDSCNLRIVKTIHPVIIQRSIYVDHGQQLLLNTTGKVTQPGCSFSVLSTNHPTIFLAPVHTVPNLPLVPTREIDPILQNHVHLAYVGYILQRRFQQQEQQSKLHVCQNHQQQEITQIPHLLPNGLYGLKKGDLYLTFQCTAKQARIQEATTCYADIPIRPSGFVKPQSRLFTPHSSKIHCSNTFPLTIEANEGWISLNPLPRKVPAPLTMPPTLSEVEDLQDFSLGGLYSDSELADFQHESTFPHYSHALLQSLSYGTCTHDGTCPTSNTDMVPYDLTNLIPAIEQKVNLWSGLTKFLHRWGDFMAFLCLGILSTKFLTDMVCVVLAAARGGPGAALAMLSQLYLFNRRTYLKIIRRYHQTHRPSTPANHNPPEFIPLTQGQLYPALSDVNDAPRPQTLRPVTFKP